MLKNDPSALVPAEIRSENEYVAVKATLSRQNRPAKLLRLLMNIFEGYRQARKIGWSRPWNKVGMRTFLAFKLDPERDRDFVARAHVVLADEAAQAPDQARAFCHELLQSSDLMAFVFFAEYEEKGERYETITLSLGRQNELSKRHRDRIDILFDANVRDGDSQGLSRLRIYIDPYLSTKEPLWSAGINHPLRESSHRAFLALAELCRQQRQNPSYVWDHWTSSYIDYFGPRQWHIENSIFGPSTSALPLDLRSRSAA